jgi:hypothetical protein
MIQLIFHHKELTRRDLIVFLFRSLLVAPVLGAPPGAAWGAFALGPIGGSLMTSVGIGALVGAAVGGICAHLMDMGTVRARTLPFVTCVLLGTAYALLAISLGALLPNKPDWLIPALMIVWLAGLTTAGWMLGRTRPA